MSKRIEKIEISNKVNKFFDNLQKRYPKRVIHFNYEITK